MSAAAQPRAEAHLEQAMALTRPARTRPRTPVEMPVQAETRVRLVV